MRRGREEWREAGGGGDDDEARVELRRTSCACISFSFARSACSFFTAADTSFSFCTTSLIMSLRAFSSSTVVVSVAKEHSRSSRSVFDSRF